jgi:hypothetical protein
MPLFGKRDDSKTNNSSLSDLVLMAEDNGVDQLIISAEQLDRLSPSEVEPLRTALGNHVVRVVFTATQPQHRWASAWQELVKHSLGAAPFPARELLLDSACLGAGKLKRLVSIFPADFKTVVLVRRDRNDPNLVSTVAAALSLPWKSGGDEIVLNQAIGEDIALLAHLNSIGVTSGLQSGRSVELFERYRQETTAKRIDQFAQWEFDLPPELREAAAAEVEFLRNAPRKHGVNVVDTAGLLDVWGLGGLPDWYRAISSGSDGPGGPLQSLEVIRLQKNLAESRACAERFVDEAVHARNLVAQELEATVERLRQTVQELEIVRSSRSLRLATWFRQALRLPKLHGEQYLHRLRLMLNRLSGS